MQEENRDKTTTSHGVLGARRQVKTHRAVERQSAPWPHVGIGTTSRKEVQGTCTFRGISCFPGFPRILAPSKSVTNSPVTRGQLVTLCAAK